MFRGTNKAILEIYQSGRGKYRWRKIGPNGRIVSISHETFTERRYAAVSGHREYPDLPVLHRYGQERLSREAVA